MLNSIRGVVKDGLIVPSAPLPEGAEVEIHLCQTQAVPVEIPSFQTEFDAWQQANTAALSSIGNLTEQSEPQPTAELAEPSPPVGTEESRASSSGAKNQSEPPPSLASISDRTDMFLQSIRDNPEDESVRLVYADWLEERGDPRAEFLRIDALLLDMPKTHDLYETHRNRYIQLRQTIDPRWVRMVALSCTEIPRGNPIPALLEFIAAWVPGLTPAHRIAASSVPAFIPPPLRSIYEIAGNWPRLFAAQDDLLPLDQLAVNGNRFKFIHENQGCWSCETLINELDPPVFCDSYPIDGSDYCGMREVCPSLSHFLTTFCLQELAFGSENLFCVDSDPKSPSELVTGEIKDLWIDGMYADQGAKYSFYLCDRVLLIMDTGHGTNCDYFLAYNKPEGSKLLSTRHEIRQIH